MQLFGRQLSNWWLLLIPPLLIGALPLLLMVFFIGNGLAGAIIGPPAIWNRTWHSPPRSEIEGKYSESGRHLDHPSELPAASLVLESDGSMTVANLPFEFGETSCTISGKGSWSGPDDEQKIGLNVISDGAAGACRSDSYSFLELAGHSKPYKLYWIVGDPDSGTGIWFHKY